MTVWLSLAALVVLGFIGWKLYGRVGTTRIAQMAERRRATSRLVSPGTFVDGNRHMDVALAVSDSTFFYENKDMEASLSLDRVREIEYDNELATGGAVARGKVLRLRSDSQTFEFVLPENAVTPWQTALPPRREGDAGESEDAARRTRMP